MAELVRTLVVDDEERIRFTLRETLQRVGHVVMTASSGEEALDMLRDNAFDAAVIDLNLGGRVDGLKVLEAIRWRWPGMAVVILTAHGSLASAIKAIQENVDDYLLKPARPDEVRQAVQRALGRRKDALAQQKPPKQRIVQYSCFFADLDRHVATKDGQLLTLTPQEFKLLVHLMENAPRVIAPRELVRAVQECEMDDLYEARQLIKWYIHRLRQQIEPDPSNPRYVLNVRGVGYTLKE